MGQTGIKPTLQRPRLCYYSKLLTMYTLGSSHHALLLLLRWQWRRLWLHGFQSQQWGRGGWRRHGGGRGGAGRRGGWRALGALVGHSRLGALTREKNINMTFLPFSKIELRWSCSVSKLCASWWHFKMTTRQMKTICLNYVTLFLSGNRWLTSGWTCSCFSAHSPFR